MDKKRRPIYVLYARDPLQTYGRVHTESERMEKGITCKWKSQESGNSNSHTRQNRP